MHAIQPKCRRRSAFRVMKLLTSALELTLALAVLFGGLFMGVQSAFAAGNLTVEILAAPNLVVDSNVLSPSTSGPYVATVIGKFCNNGDAPLNDVMGYIGDFNTTPGSSTPGFFPTRDSSDAAFIAEHPRLANSGDYAFSLLRGSMGASEQARYVGNLAVGECKVQYWHFEYPWTNPAETEAVWGANSDPSDDLWLEFDVWGTSVQGSNNFTTHRMYHRNEISAMANKIKPNPDGQWFNTNSDVVLPGETITSNGINYELGVVNQGFDNDGDFVPDYNAWLQPIGDNRFDPGCFRIIHTEGTLTVSRSSGLPDMVIPFQDNLYFTDLPPDNNGVRGEVFYTFAALNGPCSSAISPYQEVASGRDNEKFNADYGIGIPPAGSASSAVTLNKTSSPAIVSLGGTISYQITVQNDGTAAAGLPLYNMPLTVKEIIPNGTIYVAGSAAYTGSGTATVLYSTDNGVSWVTTEPAAPSITNLEWRLNTPLGAAQQGVASFQVQVPGGFTGLTYIENSACAAIGDGAPLACDSTVNLIAGNNSIGDLSWQDDDSDGITDAGEPGLMGVTLSLYLDKNQDGLLDGGDVLVTSQDTIAGGGYLFGGLPDGRFLVSADPMDGPTGYRLTTPEVYAVPLDPGGINPGSVTYLLADFGFGPTLSLEKQLSSANPAYEGESVVYSIFLTNKRPGDGSGQPAPCTFSVWTAGLDAALSGTGNKAWINPSNAYSPPGPDNQYATAPFNNAEEVLAVNSFSLGPQEGSITTVEMLLPIQVVGTLAGDLTVSLLVNGVPAANSPRTFDAATLTNGTLTINVSGDRAWSWSDFGNNSLTVLLQAVKRGNPPGDLNLDAVGLRVISSESCGGPDDTIAILPLSDSYDPAAYEFVSAEPPPSQVSAGTIAWNNLAPLFAGETKQVRVVFRALEPPDNDSDGENDPATVTNCGSSLGATFGNGDPVNDASDCTSNLVNPTGTIGDTIWNDNGLGGGSANNGLQDGGEAGIPGVTVRLWTDPNGDGNPADGALLQTAVTDSSGHYLFSGVKDGNIVVVVDTVSLPGSTFTQTGDPDVNGNCGSRCNNRGGAALNNNNGVPGDDNDLTLDFGYRIPNTVQGNVWEDVDNDGAWDASLGENGLAGVTVYLDNCGNDGVCGTGDDGATLTTPTDPKGYYVFGDLLDGNYRVRIGVGTLPVGSTWTNTADPEGDLDSRTIVHAVSGGNVYGPYDFGYHRRGTYSIGDQLYADWDADGVQDAGEEGIPNVTVYLYQDEDGDGVIDPADDGLISSTTTAGTGSYSFPGLGAQRYIIVIDEDDAAFPAGYLQTQDPDEGGLCITCDGLGRATLGPSTILVDFGYRPYGYGSIGDTVFVDSNADGIQNAGEVGIAQISVTLYEDSNANGLIDSGDAMVASVLSDAAGNYQFVNLPPGNYVVDIDTADADLPLDGNNIPYVLSTGNDPFPVSLGLAEVYLLADFGFTPGGTIGDTIWQDNDGDGSQDTSEPGIDGVLVELFVDVDGNRIYSPGVDTLHATQSTSGGGLYAFGSLPAGNYVLRVTPPGGFSLTGDPDESPPCVTCDHQSGVPLSAGQIDRSRDFGYRPGGVIGDFVWLDMDGDGMQDIGESGIGNVIVELTTQGGQVFTTRTDSDGYYAFGNLPGGNHTVRINPLSLPGGLAPSYDFDGGLDNQALIPLASGGSELGADFGYQYGGAYNLSGTVFHDDNGNGVDDETHPTGSGYYANVTIYLWDASNRLLGTTTSNASGDYSFNSLPNGAYTVSANPDAPNLTGTDPTTPMSRSVTIAGASITDLDFGFLSQVDMGDLPESYYTSLNLDGPRHVVSSLFLGAVTPDVEPNGQPGGSANGDDTNGVDDDDGVVRDVSDLWIPGSTVDLQVTVAGSNGYLVAWLDWNSSGTFESGEMVEYGSLGSGLHTLPVSVPNNGSYLTGTPLNARFRLYAGDPLAPTPNGYTNGGEVEDYRWLFGPTAVTITNLSAQASADAPWGTLVLAGFIFLAATGFRKIKVR